MGNTGKDTEKKVNGLKNTCKYTVLLFALCFGLIEGTVSLSKILNNPNKYGDLFGDIQPGQQLPDDWNEFLTVLANNQFQDLVSEDPAVERQNSKFTSMRFLKDGSRYFLSQNIFADNSSNASSGVLPSLPVDNEEISISNECGINLDTLESEGIDIDNITAGLLDYVQSQNLSSPFEAIPSASSLIAEYKIGIEKLPNGTAGISFTESLFFTGEGQQVQLARKETGYAPGMNKESYFINAINGTEQYVYDPTNNAQIESDANLESLLGETLSNFRTVLGNAICQVPSLN